MAAKRIAQSSINWAQLADRVPPHQKTNFLAFKARSDNYMRSVLANPEQAPKIDWEYYKKNIELSGLADKFQKQYEALKIPYPVDNVTSQIVEQEKTTKTEIAEFVKDSNARIQEYEAKIKQINATIPFDQMTLEDFREAYPEVALDPINRPTFWPHTPEEQLGYMPKDAQTNDH